MLQKNKPLSCTQQELHPWTFSDRSYFVQDCTWKSSTEDDMVQRIIPDSLIIFEELLKKILKPAYDMYGENYGYSYIVNSTTGKTSAKEIVC
ncbi:hypothetical protein CDAR_76991 [Caerostris darwini]|uniref:Uncharacterized protein n=1 Tax=Caerostris darwini TaxID=1538125 RepID=A0AAV4RAD3_9ARAC|nr:hypothetical protein CDAR_76991 [Caerostris darwini]